MQLRRVNMYHKPKRIESLVDALDPKKAEILHYLSVLATKRKRKNPTTEKLYWGGLFGTLKFYLIDLAIRIWMKIKDGQRPGYAFEVHMPSFYILGGLRSRCWLYETKRNMKFYLRKRVLLPGFLDVIPLVYMAIVPQIKEVVPHRESVENDYDGDCDGDEARDLGLDVFQFRGFGISRDIGFNGSQEGFVLHQIEGFGEYPKRRQINESCGFEVNLWARWELGLGFLGQVIVLLALQLVPLNQLQRAGLELDKVFMLFIMGKRSEERSILSSISAGVGNAKDLAGNRIDIDRMIFWVDQYMRQMRGSSIVAMEWRVAVLRHDGVEVHYGSTDYGISLYYISKVECNYSGKIGGGGFYPRRYAKLSMCFWFIGKGSDGFKNFNVCILKILYNIKDSCCGIEIVLFLKSSFGLWIYWDWRLCELNGKIGIFLSMLIVVRVKYSLWSQVFLSHASYVYGVSGRYEKYKWLVIMDIYGMVTKKGIYLEWGNR
ncbi:LOW QUALITY PROTEIN: hypothetical protein HID58_018729, partial [Brassica napus]